MKILKTSNELSAKQVYALTMSPEVQKMKDLVGQEIEFTAYAMYEDINSKGEEQVILSIVTPEGEILATNSPTFKADFIRMIELFAEYGETVKAFKVISGTSKNGREFITCAHAR